MDRSKAARGVVWSLVENGGLAFVSFASLILFSRYLSASEFGLFSIALAVVELVGVLVSMAFHDALVQRAEVTEKHFETAFTVTMAMSLLFMGGCWVSADYFAKLVDDPSGAGVLFWVALCLPSSALSDTLVAQLRREMKFRELALRSLVGRLSAAAIGFVLIFLGAGIWALVAQQVLIRLVGSLVLLAQAERLPRFGFSKTCLADLSHFGMFSVAAIFGRLAIARAFTIVAGIALGTELAGYLNLSFRAVDALWVIAATAAGQVALPVLSRLQDDLPRFKRAFRGAMELSCLILYPSFVGIAVVAPELVELMFGAKWLLCVPYVQALALLALVRAARLLNKPTLTAMGRPRDPLIGLVVESVVMAALFVFAGAETLPLAVGIWAAREIAGLPVMSYVLRRASGLSYADQFRGALVPLAGSIVMAGAVMGLRMTVPETWPTALRFAIFVPAGALSFLAAVWLLDRRSLLRTLEFFGTAVRKVKSPNLAGAPGQ